MTNHLPERNCYIQEWTSHAFGVSKRNVRSPLTGAVQTFTYEEANEICFRLNRAPDRKRNVQYNTLDLPPFLLLSCDEAPA